jgi:hypothetical protein
MSEKYRVNESTGEVHELRTSKQIKAEKKRMESYAATFKVGQRVRYYGLMQPRKDLLGEAEIGHIGKLSNEPVVWLKGAGAYHIDAIEAV